MKIQPEKAAAQRGSSHLAKGTLRAPSRMERGFAPMAHWSGVSHFFGTATLSFADGIRCEPGDAWQIQVADFGLPLTNPLHQQPAETGPLAVIAL